MFFSRFAKYCQRAPSVPSRTCEIGFWKCSGVQLIPKGRRLKQTLLNWVTKVVRFADSSDRPICQNPEFASSWLNTVAWASWVWSTLGGGWNSLGMFSLRFVKSTQMRTLPLAFGETTIPAHHSVGSSTLEMICICSIRESSSSIFVRRGSVWLQAWALWRKQGLEVF